MAIGREAQWFGRVQCNQAKAYFYLTFLIILFTSYLFIFFKTVRRLENIIVMVSLTEHHRHQID